jgi:nicotinamidase-related amidase
MAKNVDENLASAPLPRSPELMNADDTLLCVVDVQERLLPAIAGAGRIVWNTRRLIEGAGILGVEVVATEQYPEKLGPTVEPLASLIPSPRPGKLDFSSGACGELFAGRLNSSTNGGRHRVLLCGIETHVCVQQSAYDLTAAGFQVFLASDATGTRHAPDHEIALRRLESAGVVLTTTEAALFEWCAAAGTPQFKQISRLVKETMPSS